MAADLVCPACGAAYDAGPAEPWRCDCGHALDIAAELHLPPDPPAPRTIDTREGLWAVPAFLPIERQVSLGEGWTPLVESEDWNATFKLEYVFPSGSFKDRGAATTLSRAVALGPERVVDDSSGNAGAAIAQYAARAGIAAEIYVPADAKASKRRAIDAVGATVVPVEGSRSAVTAACVERVEAGEAWYASHAWNPAFYAGTATIALEICAQRDWSAPEAVISPIGHGTLFLGAYRGFRTLAEAGWIDAMPRMLGVQAAGCAPIVETLGGDADGENDALDGIQIAEPARSDQLLDAIRATDGAAIAVGEAVVEDAVSRLNRGGFYVEPTSAAAPAGLQVFRETGALEPDADVVVPLTGSGLKT